MIPDGVGGVIMVWKDGDSWSNIAAQRVNNLGQAMWTPNGVSVCVANNVQERPRICSDGAEGVIVAWQDGRVTSLGRDIYAQRIDAGGNALWANDGVSVCIQSEWQFDPRVVSDGAGGSIVVDSVAGEGATITVDLPTVDPGAIDAGISD